MTKKAKKPNQTLKIPRIILVVGKFLSFISTKLVVLYAARLFTTPIKYKIPKRELEMDAKSRQETIAIPNIERNIVLYHFGESPRKVLLVHGWSGRGTQLVKFAEELVKLGYSTISFDAPAHGKSSGSRTLMPEFIESILEIDRELGPFEAAIGHSLGGMSLLNATKKGFEVQRLVTIGSADIVKDIIDDFIKRLELKPEIGDLLRLHFEETASGTMDSYSSYHAATGIEFPVLIVHDQDDDEVPASCALHIHKNLKHGTLLLTKNLGHRKILGNEKVIEKVLNFIQK